MASFSLQIDRFVKTVKAREDVVIRRVGLQALESVVYMSPVGNPDLWKRPRKGYVGGRFRGNWQVGLNAPIRGTLQTIDPSGTQTIARGKQALSLAKAGGVIYLSNNLPYSLAIEFGHSQKQAPRGVVRITAARLQGMLDKAVAAAKKEVP